MGASLFVIVMGEVEEFTELVDEPLVAAELGVVVVGGAVVLDGAADEPELVRTAVEVVTMAELLPLTLLGVTGVAQGLPDSPPATDAMRARIEGISKEAYIDVSLHNRRVFGLRCYRRLQEYKPEVSRQVRGCCSKQLTRLRP